MPRDQKQRRTDDLTAMQVLSKNLSPVMTVVAQVVAEVGPGQTELLSCVQDARLALDIAKRLDDAIPTPEPVETWDGFLWLLVASVALAIYRRTLGSSATEAKAEGLAARALAKAQARAL